MSNCVKTWGHSFNKSVISVAVNCSCRWCWCYCSVCVCARDFNSVSQTKSCSSFPEWLRLSFRPDRILWAGEVSLCSLGSVFDDWLCPTLVLLFEWFSLRSAWCPARADSCVEADEVTVPADVNAESSPSMYCTTSRGLRWTSALLSEAPLVWWGWQLFSLWRSDSCSLGSGEELRLLSALSGWPWVSGASGRPVVWKRFGDLVAGLLCRRYFTGCLVKW